MLESAGMKELLGGQVNRDLCVCRFLSDSQVGRRVFF